MLKYKDFDGGFLASDKERSALDAMNKWLNLQEEDISFQMINIETIKQIEQDSSRYSYSLRFNYFRVWYTRDE